MNACGVIFYRKPGRPVRRWIGEVVAFCHRRIGAQVEVVSTTLAVFRAAVI